MVYAMDLDLTTSLYGYDMFAPIIVGPVGNQGDIHPEGELATARGASAGKAVMVATRQSSHSIEEIVAASDEPVWYQLYADSGSLGADVARAVDAGCRAVCVTVGRVVLRSSADLDGLGRGRPRSSRRWTCRSSSRAS